LLGFGTWGEAAVELLGSHEAAVGGGVWVLDVGEQPLQLVVVAEVEAHDDAMLVPGIFSLKNRGFSEAR